MSATCARGQGTVPVLRLTAPDTAAPGRTTTVSADFILVGSQTLLRHPRVRVERVVNGRTRLVELLPLRITQQPPAGRGFRALNTGTYPPGTYSVRLECDCRDASGKLAAVASPVTTLTVPGR
jgi:hypothetical protein